MQEATRSPGKLMMLVCCLGLVAAGAMGPAGASAQASAAEEKRPLEVAMLIAGSITDGGFMQAGYTGLQKIKAELGAQVFYIDKIKPELPALTEALRELARRKPDLVIAHGGQNNEAAKRVAEEFPDLKFVVTQGNVTGKNLASYEALQEQSAWLAGAAAGLLTKTQVVGHISGIRVVPGLKGRGAFAAGLKYTNPQARLLTTFSGTQDDNEVNRKVALAQIKDGADIIFTMLNAGRAGVTEACREQKVFQIGNVRDWYPVAPEVFIASAVSDVSVVVYQAGEDVAKKGWRPGIIKKIGLEDAQAVRLALAPHVPKEIEARVQDLTAKIVRGEIKVSVDYAGPEFEAK